MEISFKFLKLLVEVFIILIIRRKKLATLCPKINSVIMQYKPQGGVCFSIQLMLGIYLFIYISLASLLSLSHTHTIHMNLIEMIQLSLLDIYTIRNVLLLLAISEFVNLVSLSLFFTLFFICRISTHSFLLALSLFALFK